MANSDLFLVDVHAHLDHVLLKDDLDEVLAKSRADGVRAIITNGVNPASNEAILELAKRDPIIKVALGLYPTDALGHLPDAPGLPHPGKPFDVGKALDFIESHKKDIVAIGEVGLEFKMDKDAHDNQKAIFQDIIDLSRRIKRPMIIHSRGAEGVVVDMLQSSNVKNAVLHCFSGSKKLISKASDMGLTFSVPVSVLRSQHFQMLVGMVKTSQLLTETDSPWLGPVQGERNVPQNVKLAVEKIAEIKSLDVKETSMMLFKNYQSMFSN